MNYKRLFKWTICIMVMLLWLPAGGNAAENKGMRPFWHPDAGSPSQRFEMAKQTTPELVAFVRRMPKGADLHLHVSGGVYCEYILETAEKAGLFYNIKTMRFQREKGREGDKNGDKNIIPAADIKKDTRLLYRFMDHFSMRGWYENSVNGHDHFFNTFSHIGSFKQNFHENAEVFISEIVKRNRYEQVQYLELMNNCIPIKFREKVKTALDGFTGFDEPALRELEGKELETAMEEVLNRAFKRVKPVLTGKAFKSAVNENLDKQNDNIKKRLGISYDIAGNDGDLVIRYIEMAVRFRDLKGVFQDVAAGIAAVNSDHRVVALNIAAPEEYTVSRIDFEKHMMILDFLWRKMGRPNFTLHGGELVLRESPVEPMINRIRYSIEKGRARRIGHGISIAWEKDLVGLLSKMRDEKIMVEICLSSNESILGIKNADHPFNLYRRSGVPLSINTDDPGVSRSNLTMEMVKAIQRYNLSYEEVKTLVRNSLEYSFLPGESLFINGNYTQLRPGFENLYSRSWKPGNVAERLIKKHPKLKRQLLLEQKLGEFERSLLNGFREN